MDRPQLSADYFRAIEESYRHHLASKTYSGRFLRPHAAAIAELLGSRMCLSILDYGCGKGAQYQWRSHDDSAGVPKGSTLEQFWRIMVRKYDPAWPAFADFPESSSDLVICTHVLGCIPLIDLPAIVGEVTSLANKVVYVAERIGMVRKDVFSSTIPMARGFSRKTWIDTLRENRRGPAELWLATTERTAEGKITTRERVD